MPPRFSADDYYDPQDDSDYSDEEAPVRKPPPKAAGRAPAGRGAAGRLGAALAAPGRGRGRGGAAPAAPRFPVAPPPPPVAAPAFAFDTPSPDDAVRLAQAGRVPGAAPRKPVSAAPPAPQSAPPASPPSLASLSLSSSRFSSYAAESWELASGSAAAAPPPLHVCALGHVDAGKSSALGRLLHAITGAASPGGRRAGDWAWAFDSGEEERRRGVTLAVGSARAGGLVLLDCPGHRDYVPQAMEGCARADVALLFLDCAPGALEAGLSAGAQTQEHAALCRAAGCGQLICVANKMDATQPQAWAAERFLQAQELVGVALREAGWRPDQLCWVPLCGREGINLTEPLPPTHPARAWYSGPSLLEVLLSAPRPPQPPPGAPLRLPVWEVVGEPGATKRTVSGRLESGTLRPGMSVVLQPSGCTAVVRSVTLSGCSGGSGGTGGAVPAAAPGPGEAVEVVLEKMSDSAGLVVGQVLCPVRCPAVAATRLQLRLRVMPGLRVPLLRGTEVTLHLGGQRAPGHISALVEQLCPKSGEVLKARPRCLARGGSGRVEVSLEEGRLLAAETYEDCRAMGRAVLREGGVTLAMGVVERVWEGAAAVE